MTTDADDIDEVLVGHAEIARERREAALQSAEAEGLLGPQDDAIAGRVPAKLLERAKQQSRAESMDELLVYALPKVAIEDDSGPPLVARSGRVPRGTLEG